MKPYLNYKQQIEKLINEKALIISNSEYAESLLIDIGYFSLIGGYKNMFINPMTRKYIGNTAFEDIVALYRFDEELRHLTFKYITRIEQKIRQVISDSFCKYYGESQSEYLSPKNYTQDKKKSNEIIKMLQILDYHANKNSDKAYLTYQRKTYGNVPLWVTTKILTFGQLSKLYGLMQHRQQSAISKYYKGVSEKTLEKYLNCLTLFRNVCAHNERLFNHKLIQREFPDTELHKKMCIEKNGEMYAAGKKDYFGLVIAFRYLLRDDEFHAYKKELKRIIKSYISCSDRLREEAILNKMGMPTNWEKISRYKI